MELKGMGVALVTPFTHNKSIEGRTFDKAIDYERLAELIEYQIAGGADFIVVLGTTAETPALNAAERAEVRSFVARQVAGRVPLVVGIGGNSTRCVIDEILSADLTPFSAILSVVPFYNKPSQEGIYQHYAAIAQWSPLPIILYNVPGRTGVNMLPDTTLRLAREFKNIIAVKEASGIMTQIDEIIKYRPEGFKVFSGDDGITLPLITLGADGVISVVGNAFPQEFSTMVRLALEGNFVDALPIHHKLKDFFRLLFVDGNPSGIKCLLHAMGLIDHELRLPLVPVTESTERLIRAALAQVRPEFATTENI